MKIMEEDDLEVNRRGDKECDFGNYIDDEEENVSPIYSGGYFEDGQLSPNTNSTEPKKNSVESLVRHFKIFFPKIKRNKHSVQPQPIDAQQSGLRSFSFADSKMGKDFEHFTMGHAFEAFDFDAGYFDDCPKVETAPPLYGNRRSRIVGDETFFRNTSSTTNHQGIDDFTESMNRDATKEEEEEEKEDEVRREDEEEIRRNGYLFPMPSSPASRDQYQNFSEMDREAPSTSRTSEEEEKKEEEEEEGEQQQPNGGNRIASGLYETPYDVDRERRSNDFTKEFSTTGDDHRTTSGKTRNEMTTDAHGTSGGFDALWEESRRFGSSSGVISDDDDDLNGSNSLSSDPRRNAAPSLLRDVPPEPPPVNPNRPVFTDEKIRVYRDVDGTVSGSTGSLKRKSNNFLGKALRRISSYFSLKNDESWKVGSGKGIELSKF